ncbi:hypothetical protein LQ567_04015 [Niabella pedocola]|uniref:Uncharacterized protein n=1 Tax=Niabella pedocola TaxID=1752077 RepID=A0ABS8PLC8_9BACT|nr:hypothetical protein [Niabella pedocola]MCD2421914.1 hypothetical protein [Niabella pedocola]
MNKTAFYIVVDMKTPDGYISYCHFFIGGDKDRAEAVFNSLNGIIPDIADSAYVLRMCLVCRHNNSSIVKAMRYCTLDDLAVNVPLITREVFKWLTLH